MEKIHFLTINDPNQSFKLCQNYLESKRTNPAWEDMSWSLHSPRPSPTKFAWDEMGRSLSLYSKSESEFFSMLEECLGRSTT